VLTADNCKHFIISGSGISVMITSCKKLP